MGHRTTIATATVIQCTRIRNTEALLTDSQIRVRQSSEAAAAPPGSATCASRQRPSPK